ncbi:ABC transporter permease [Haloplanus aerogenes]|uniref:ABC transporter permease n=1 Tax=Haloplanus aerogenes TaxID=660522 RepID=A0A3M0DYY1_9EURY|nr:ABC transporter permease [Haloplanus aerogenes]AZH25262.1 ABC transporter permease [Haloplanus aerogenes]RMB24953.1 peptide/nickel transport system permease protein [Haloplanus aerogenes]
MSQESADFSASRKTGRSRVLAGAARGWRIIRSNHLATAGFLIVLGLVFVAIFAPFLAPYDPSAQDLDSTLAPPSADHPLGTDNTGRDILSRIIFGTRYALAIALVVVTLETLIGVSLGLIAGYYKGRVDETVMRGLDVLVSIPPLLLAMVIVTTFGINIWNAMLAIGIVYIPMMSRTVRSSALSIREETYVQAAEGLGYDSKRVMLKHILPNAVPPIVVLGTTDVAYALIDVATLSFLGLGIQPPKPSWGAMANAAQEYILVTPWPIVFPTIAIAIAVLGFNLLGMGLREVLLYGGDYDEVVE